MTIALILDRPECNFLLREPFDRFVVEEDAQLTLRMRAGFPAMDYGSQIFDNGTRWALYQSDQQKVIYTRSYQQDPSHIVVLDPSMERGDLYLDINDANCRRIEFPLLYPLGEVLMINLLAQGYGILMHACAIKDGDSGYLFTGISGAGKTTTALLWKEKKDVTLLSDDRVIVRQRDGRFWIYGTPWWGDAYAAAPESVPLERIFILRHAERNEAISLTPMEATTELLIRSFPTYWDEDGMAFTLDLLGELTQSIPCYRFGFVPEQSAVDLVRCLE